ncbi:mitochondrial import receptor subunit TOM20 homolog [Physeter macrocephalus]|uniref:Mitochondrial import receptor subunit TOM20 homolog n=1 Tax=Physeter macrocephalus TaxID=9755 RepID=A0A9W2W9B9_PHYMC|nr:mitochondrial import receptor subunit TOM20 homolog [Physeter catodon]
MVSGYWLFICQLRFIFRPDSVLRVEGGPWQSILCKCALKKQTNKQKSFPRPSLWVSGQSGAVRSEGSRPAASSPTPPPPTPLLIEEEMEGQNGTIATSVCRALFIGSYIYFDRKRQSDPNIKNRLREQRKKQKLAKERAALSKLPDLKDAEAVHKFFLKEIWLSKESLAQGEYEKGVDHLTNAIAVCGQPQQLLQVLQQTLPPPVFQMLLTKLPTISQRIVSAQSLAEDDVE